MLTQIENETHLTLGARILCAVVQLARKSEGESVFSKQDIAQMVETLFPGSMKQPGLSTHLSSHCVVNTNKNCGTEQRFMLRVGHGRLRLARSTDLVQNRSWVVTWPNFDNASHEEKEMLQWAQAYFGATNPVNRNEPSPTLLDLAGSARHLFVHESAAEYIAKMNEAWN